MKLLILSRYEHLGSSSRLRFYQYLPYLKSHGIDFTVHALLDNDYIRNLYAGTPQRSRTALRAYVQRFIELFKAGAFDLLWIEKELFPWLPPWAELLLKFFRIPYLVDYDDAIFHYYDSRPLTRFLLGKKIAVIMRNAQVVTVGNRYIANYARKTGARCVEHIPTVVDLERYQAVFPHKKSEFTIGWIGAPISAPFLHLVEKALAEVCKKGNVKVKLIGPGPLDLKGVPVQILPWRESTEVSVIQTFDVGIMPVPDQPFERGKSGYKLIQYMGCGLPVVASPVGENQHIVEEGINGFLAGKTETWIRALKTLRDNPELRLKMGKAGRIKVESQYSLQVTAPKLLSLLEKAATYHPELIPY